MKFGVRKLIVALPGSEKNRDAIAFFVFTQ